MKTLLYVIGGVVCVGLIIVAMYIAMTIGISVYIAKTNNMRAQERAAAARAAEDAQMRHSIDTLGDNMRPEVIKKHDEDELAGKSPSLFADLEGYGTEDNWLATQISREVAEMAFFAAQPGVPLPDLKVKAQFDPAQMQVNVEIEGWGIGVTTSELSPAFAWDPNGYAPLAQQLIGTTAAVADEPELADNDVLANLLELTGPKLAMEDVQLSQNLQAHPASWQDHEAAALLLMALALRNEDSHYADNRPLLCKAVAHLALAQAWRGPAHPTWAGLIAGAAIRTIANREVDALAHLDNLSTQADLPDEAKPWIMALRLRATQDWRKAEVTEKSPLLLKMMWYRILLLDLTPEVAQTRLEQVVPQPPQDPSQPADQQKTNSETLIPDWGRIGGASPFYDEGDDSVKNAQYKMDLEFHELDEILKQENATSFDLDHLATVFAEGTTDSVSQDTSGKTTLRVIGPGVFKAISLGHVFDGMIAKDIRGQPNQDAAQGQDLFNKMEGLFHDVPGYDFVRLHLGFVDNSEMQRTYAELEAAKKTWPVWAMPHGLTQGMPGSARVDAFYRKAVPFGTAFEASYQKRFGFIRNVDPLNLPEYNSPELEALKKLPAQEAIKAINDYNLKIGREQAAAMPKGPQPFEIQLLKLDPDNYFLAVDYVPNEKMITVAARFLDYNVQPLNRIETVDSAHLSDADRIAILRKHVALDPECGFRAGVFLRSKGLDDEAAEMDRRAFYSGSNPIAISNQVLPLVDYDLTHGKNDEAVKVAQFAGQVASEMGLSILTFAMEKLGRLDEAEAAARQDAAMYSDPTWLTYFQLRHPDRYPEVYANELKARFPDGLKHAGMSDFTDSPKAGAIITSDSDVLKGAGLAPGDVIVALDGYEVDSEPQYMFIRSLSLEPKMDFIIWRKDKYLKVAASVPSRRMMVDIVDFPAN